jgi:thiol:disulfide interchange protein
MNWLRWLILLVALAFGAAAKAAPPPMDIHVAARLEAETLRPAPGSTVTLAITMEPDAGWHGYWINPGDAGQGLQLDWRLPAGVSVGTPRFPVPETLIISGLMNYVYERPHAILMDVTLPSTLALGSKVLIAADALWLACTDRVCVPQQGKLQLELTIGDGRIDAASRTKFDQRRAALPVALDQPGRFAVSGKQIEIAIPFPENADAERPYFFPLTEAVVDYAAPQSVRRTGDWLVVQTKQQADPAVVQNIEGLFRYADGQGVLVKASRGAIPAGGKEIATGSPAGPTTPPLMLLLLGALIGGVLLNIMPCVFPILGLKALALAKAGGNEGAARADAIAYTFGTIISCVALGGIMLALRAGGEEIGWAFQLQEPGFVLFLFILMVGIAANLFGIFDVGGLQIGDALTRKPGLTGSFWTGALAAIVATPCTGPFMAAALGAALLLPSMQALMLFAALGFGIASPFLLIAYIPALRRRLPKPGPWLDTFRKLMAFPMALTALALGWLLWRLTGIAGLTLGLVAAFIVLVIAVRFPMMSVSRKANVAKFVLAASVFLGAVVTLPYVAAPPQSGQSSILQSTDFSEERLSALRKEGKPVFVYFTADWCVTCKVNEAAVLERDDTAQLFKRNGIIVLRGDFTKRDPAIARFLAAKGAAGVPLYLYYPKGEDARQLPQLLSQSTLKEMLSTGP